MRSATRDDERQLLMVSAVVAAVALGRAVQFGNGAFTPDAIWWLVGACVVMLGGWLAPAPTRLTAHLPTLVAVVAALGLVFQFSVFASSPPAIYLQAREPDPWKTFQAGIGVAGVLAGLMFSPERWVRRLAVPALILTYLVMGKWLIFASPAPAIDVWYIHQESLAELLKGHNPYTLTFRNIYGDDRFFGPGMVQNGRLMFGYTYPPLSLILSIPGYLFGDYRYSLMVCNAATATLMALARPSKLSTTAAALFLFTPRSIFVLEQGWTEPMLLLSIAAVGFTALRFPKALPYAAGVMLASKQYAFLMAPAFLLLPQVNKERATLIGFAWRAVAVAAALTVPFLLWDPKGFVHSIFMVQLGLPFRNDSLNFSAWWVQRGGTPPPGILGWLMLLPAYAALWWRAPRTAGGFAITAGSIMLSFVIFNRQAFCNYYFLILGALLVGAAFSFPLDDDAQRIDGKA